LDGKMRMPVLYRDGPEHREHRRQTAKYFTPKRVDTAYRELMDRLAEQQCDVLRRRGEADLPELSFRLAVAVAAEVIGLTESGAGMAKRLDRFFTERGGTPAWRTSRQLRPACDRSLHGRWLADVRRRGCRAFVKNRSSRFAIPAPLSVRPMTSAATATARRNESSGGRPRRAGAGRRTAAREPVHQLRYAVSTRFGVKYFAVWRRCSRCSGPSR